MSNLTTSSTALAVKQQLDKNKEVLIRTLPKGFNFDRMCRTAINAISTNPTVASCTPSSIFLGIIKAFSLGLEPNGALGEGYLIPFRNSGVMEATFMPSYKGMINLAKRSGKFARIFANEVYEKDHFEYVNGTESKLEHRPPKLGDDRGKVLGYYAIVTDKDGYSDFEVMPLSDIEKIRKISKAPNSPAWTQFFDMMGRKTVLKRLLSRTEMSIELAGVIQQDNNAVIEAKNDALDIDGLTVEPEKSSIELQSPAIEGKLCEDNKASKVTLEPQKQVIESKKPHDSLESFFKN